MARSQAACQSYGQYNIQFQTYIHEAQTRKISFVIEAQLFLQADRPVWGLHFTHIVIIFRMASLIKGIYDKPYQANARTCKMQNNKARPKFTHQKAAQRVNTRHVNMIVVARALVLSHILFSCLTGPIRNMVLQSEQMFPKV